jgi:predicted nucleic acid-binding protein
MKVLLDTNVVSELVKSRPDPGVASFVASQADPVLSVITLHELTYGAERAPDPARRAKLRAWIAAIRVRFAGRLIAVTPEIAEEGGRMRATAAAQGRPVEAIDALIAASAAACAARVATRNTKDFESLGIETVNPWKG